jgi:hypothetical protein
MNKLGDGKVLCIENNFNVFAFTFSLYKVWSKYLMIGKHKKIDLGYKYT